jgi:hypothetical protein
LLLDDSGTNQVAALESMLFLRDPFPVINDAFQMGRDQNTRVVIFLNDFSLPLDQPVSSVVVVLQDGRNRTYEVPAEDVRRIPFLDFTQIVFRLPDDLAPGTCTIKVRVDVRESNTATMRIRG